MYSILTNRSGEQFTNGTLVCLRRISSTNQGSEVSYCILFFLYVILKMFARIRRLEKSLTELVRQQAQKEARTINEMTDAV